MKKRLIKWMSTWPFWAKNIVYTVWLKTTRAGRVANERERLVVSSWEEITECGEFYHVMHAHRYWWAKKIIPPKSYVIDQGCGSGYGAWYLAGENYVCGYDPDEESIKWAKDYFKKPSLTYTITLDQEDPVDVITSFEVVEHDPENVMKDIFKHLKKDGLLIISTPNAEETSVRQWLLDRSKVILNHTHVKEFTREEFFELLDPHFNSVEIFGQCPNNVRNFWDYEEWRRRRGVTLDDFHMSKTDFVNCEVIVAVCRGHKK